MTVLAFGDSMTGGWGPALARARPDLSVIQQGVAGDTTPAALPRFQWAVRQYRPDWVVLMMGTNDPGYTGIDPDRTAVNLYKMATMAQAAGAQVLVVTQPPSVCTWTKREHGYLCALDAGLLANHAQRTEHTAAVAAILNRWPARTGRHVLDLRAELDVDTWLPLTWDGLHPTDEGYAWMADRIVR